MDLKAIASKRSFWIVFGLIPALSFLLHFQIFSTELRGIHAWRQTETMSNVVNFYERDFHPVNPQVHSLEWENGLKRMEFPIMQWIFAWFYFLFGEQLWIIRFLTFIIGLFSVWGMYRLAGHLFQDRWRATLTAWCFAWSPVFFYYTVNPLPDNFALMAGIWGLAYFVRWHRKRDAWDLWFSAAFLLLASLAKLPFILFYGLPFGYALWDTLKNRFRTLRANLLVALPGILSLALPAAWYIKVIPTWHGNGVVGGIFHSGPDELWVLTKIFVKNLVSTLPELLINYGSFGFFLAGAWLLYRNRMRHRSLWPAMAFVAGGLGFFYMFELNMITTVHDYYLFPFLPFLFLVVGYGAGELWKWEMKWVKPVATLALVIIPLLAVLRSYPRWSSGGFPEDLLEFKEELQEAVPDASLCLVGHDKSPHIFLYHLHKRGWHVDLDIMEEERISRCISYGAQFLYSSSREMEAHPAMQPHLAEQIAEYGVFKVWSLK